MITVAEIELHIELVSIRDYANEMIRNMIIPINGNQILTDLKNAVIKSDFKPFLLKSEKETTYYKKYQRLESEYDEKLIPDFFSYEGDFYDLDTNINFSIEKIGENLFQKLFVIKLMEFHHSNIFLKRFLNFQLQDNFFGNKNDFGMFLQKFLSKDSICCLFPSIVIQIQEWLSKNNLAFPEEQYNQIMENLNREEKVESINSILNARKNFEIRGNMSIEEIRHYFSFLYTEIYDKKKPELYRPFLTKAEVDQIFANGLIIPTDPSAIKFKLNADLRFPKKIVDFAIHQFFMHNSMTKKDKTDYVLFFAHFLDDYSNALLSEKSLKNVCSNITGERGKRGGIKWENYLPVN